MALLLAYGARPYIKNNAGLTPHQEMKGCPWICVFTNDTAEAIIAYKVFVTGGRDELAKKYPIVAKLPLFEYLGLTLTNKKKWKKAVFRLERSQLIVYKGESASKGDV